MYLVFHGSRWRANVRDSRVESLPTRSQDDEERNSIHEAAGERIARRPSRNEPRTRSDISVPSLVLRTTLLFRGVSRLSNFNSIPRVESQRWPHDQLSTYLRRYRLSCRSPARSIVIYKPRLIDSSIIVMADSVCGIRRSRVNTRATRRPTSSSFVHEMHDYRARVLRANHASRRPLFILHYL